MQLHPGPRSNRQKGNQTRKEIKQERKSNKKGNQTRKEIKQPVRKPTQVLVPLQDIRVNGMDAIPPGDG